MLSVFGMQALIESFFETWNYVLTIFFYSIVQVGGPMLMKDLMKFAEMEPKLSSYAGHIANKPPPNYK